MSKTTGTASSTDRDQLQAKTPDEAWNKYARRKENKYRPESLASIDTAWSQFSDWFTTETSHDYLRDLSPYFAGRFQDWIRATKDQKDISIAQNLQRVRQIMDHAQTSGMAPPDVPIGWDIPEVSDDEEVRSNPMPPERGPEIMDHLLSTDTYGRDTVLFALEFRYGLRNSAIRAIDLSDVKLSPDGEMGPHIDLKDRPDLGLPLKNKNSRLADRAIPLDDDTRDLLLGYIRHERNDNGTDEHGLEGLITTERSARISKSCVGNRTHAVTSPIAYEGECHCPGCREYHDEHGEYPPVSARISECERTFSPHQVRHGAITHMLNEPNRKDPYIVSKVVGTSVKTIKDVYDGPDKQQKLARVAEGWLS